MINACPICIWSACGVLPEKVVPIPANLSSYGHFESYETLGTVFDRHGVVDSYELDREIIVLKTWEPKNVFCGGECKYGLEIANHRTGRRFSNYSQTVYISMDDDGVLRTAIPG